MIVTLLESGPDWYLPLSDELLVQTAFDPAEPYLHLTIVDGVITLRKTSKPRSGWAEAAAKIAASSD